MTIEAGQLRLRFYIDGQWSDLVRQIQAGEGTLQDLVPFKMKPIPVAALNDDEGDEEATTISTRTLGAHPIPGLSRDAPEFKTPLWKNAFPSLRFGTDTETEE